MKNRKMKTERESASNFLIMLLFFVQVFNDMYIMVQINISLFGKYDAFFIFHEFFPPTQKISIPEISKVSAS